MKIALPNSAFLGNFEAFVRSFDPMESERLKITANKKWISVHPAVLAMVAALGQTVRPSAIVCEPFEAKSRHYFERMGLFKFLGVDSSIKVVEHDPTGRFIPCLSGCHLIAFKLRCVAEGFSDANCGSKATATEKLPS
ncbi:hypothetical protein WDW37_21070 [Bdellovibrionota bacterium FG-1]